MCDAKQPATVKQLLPDKASIIPPLDKAVKASVQIQQPWVLLFHETVIRKRYEAQDSERLTEREQKGLGS